MRRFIPLLLVLLFILLSTIVGLQPIFASSVMQIDSLSGYGLYGGRACDGVLPTYNDETASLELVNTDSGELIRVVETGVGQMQAGRFSPDCCFIAGWVDLENDVTTPPGSISRDDDLLDEYANKLVLWNAETGQREYELVNPYRYLATFGFAWSPESDRLVVQTSDGTFIYTVATRALVLLRFADDTTDRFDPQELSYWDYGRGQLLLGGDDATYAFDMTTGLERARFAPGRLFTVLNDESTLVVSGDYLIGVYDIGTQDGAVVYAGGRAFRGDRVAVSPDGRYLVMARLMIRVWDLTALPEDLRDRAPTFDWSGPLERIDRVRFIDAVTVEVTDYADAVSYWNVETGAQVQS